MVTLKPGVKLRGLQPEMVVAFAIVAAVFEKRAIPCTVTSGLDGTHAAKSALHRRSLHYDGLALDFRVASHDRPGPTDQIDRQIAAECRAALGPEFDVLLEETPKHMHIEHDPKAVTA